MDNTSTDKLDKFIHDLVAENFLPGALLLVHINKEPVYFRCEGWADTEKQTPWAKDTIGRIFSMTKPIASICALLLLEEGRISLDDDIGKHIPEWDSSKLRVVEGAETTPLPICVTVRHLLTHTSGLSYGFWDDITSPTASTLRKKCLQLPAPISTHNDTTEEPYPESLADFCKRVCEVPLLFPPGTRFHYGCSIDVLGRLIECVAGVPLATFVRQRVLDPLEMHDTDFGVPPSKFSRFAASHRSVAPQVAIDLPPEAPKYTIEESIHSNPNLWCALPPAEPNPPSFRCPSAGGGLMSTASDYMRFLEAITFSEGSPFPASVREILRIDQLGPMKAPNTSLAASYPLGFGLGLSVGVLGNEHNPNAGGWGGAAGTYCVSDTQNGLTMVLMIQTMEYYNTKPTVRHDFVKLVYETFVGEHAAAKQTRKIGFTG